MKATSQGCVFMETLHCSWKNIFHANFITKEALALHLQHSLKLVSTNGIFLSSPILVDRFFVEYWNMAALKILYGKDMIIAVIVLIKETEEPSSSKKLFLRIIANVFRVKLAFLGSNGKVYQRHNDSHPRK